MVEPTPLKNMSQNWESSPIFGVKTKNIYIWNHQPVMNIAPEKWWWEDDGFLLGPGLFSGALCGKTSGEYSSWWWALILLDDRGCYIHSHHPQSYKGWRIYHDFKPPEVDVSRSLYTIYTTLSEGILNPSRPPELHAIIHRFGPSSFHDTKSSERRVSRSPP